MRSEIRGRSLRKGDGNVHAGAAEVAGVFPRAHRLVALGDPVERRDVAVLPRDRNVAGKPLRGERRHHAAGGAVVGGDHRVDVVVVGGQALLHVDLCILGQPAVGIELADDLDIALLNVGS